MYMMLYSMTAKFFFLNDNIARLFNIYNVLHIDKKCHRCSCTLIQIYAPFVENSSIGYVSFWLLP